MEVDAAPQFGLDGHIDDDLINYDSDAEKGLDHVENTEAMYVETANSGNAEHQEYDQGVVDKEGIPDEVDFFDKAEQNGIGELQQELEHVDAGHEEEQELSHEIDYDFDEPIHQDTEAVANEDETIVAADDQQPEEGQYGEQIPNEEGSGNKPEDHEISWEQEGEAEDEGVIRAQDQVTAHDSGEDISPDEPALLEPEQPAALDQHDSAAAETEEPHSEQLEAVGDEMEHDGEVHENVELNDHSQQEYSDVDEHGFPSITVQYKGDEFPFFSPSSEGFFSQLSVLDDNLKTVLSGLREELANELLPEDDIVFQVDELGLEFAESSSPDLLSNITLRQIIEVFDILVKNEDPENSRTLYTYLFTRPSTSKRFDFLMESATEGKGLDEVIHLFQSPMPQTTGLTDMSVGDDFDTQLDDYDSAGDDHAAEEQETGDGADTLAESEQVVDETVDDDSGPDQLGGGDEDHVDDEAVNEPEVLATSHGDEMQEPVKETQSFGEALASGALAPEDDVGDGEENEGPLHEEEPHQMDEQANDLLDLDFTEAAQVVDGNLVEINDQADQVSSRDTNANMDATDDTTATETLNGDGQATSPPAEFDLIDTIIDETAVEDPVEQDDLAEIDWTDEAEPHQNNELGGGDELSSSVKRARGDDELGAENNKNAKRRCS